MPRRGRTVATTKEFHDYVLEQLQKAGYVATRKMMGEYCVYFNGKLKADRICLAIAA